MSLRRNALGRLLPRLAAVGLLLGAAAAAAQEGAGYAAWFRTDFDAAVSWQFTAVDEDPMMVAVAPRDPARVRKHVFVLYPGAAAAHNVCISKILTVFQAKGIRADLTVVNYQGDDASGREALKLATGGRYNLIFSMGSAATAWLHENYVGGTVPVVSVCAPDPVPLGQARGYERGSGTNFAFTSLNMPTEIQLEHVLALKPELKNLAVIVDRPAGAEAEPEPITVVARERGVRVQEITLENGAEAASELTRLVTNAVAAMRKSDPELAHSLFWITNSPTLAREIGTINANADRVPVLSVVPEVVTAGDDSAVMSIGISFASNAHLAALYAIDVLSGRRSVGDLKVGVVSPPDIAINFRRAREIGLEIPYSLFEGASFVYDYDGRPVRMGRRSVR